MLWYGSMICSYLCVGVPSAIGSQYGSTDIAPTYLHRLGLVVARVDGVLAVAGCAHQLPAINRNRCELQRAICVLHPSTVLPLHDAAGA